jgi:outer membrane protein assembly factor BamA
MKKLCSVLFIFLLVLTAYGQEKEKKVKEKVGWKFGGALPAVTYDSNLGFQYGALFELYNYGNPTVYPEYLDHTYTEVSRFTKGSAIYRFMYESNHLIPRTHLVFDLSYLPDKANDFYGFNGYESIFNKDWTEEGEAYKSGMFYRMDRNLFRIKTDIQGKLTGDHIKWSAGFAFQNFSISSVDIDKFNEGRDDPFPSVTEEPGLYEIYRDSLGIISANEADGGWVNTLKAGVVWDSRDNRPNPMKGLWTEMGIEIAPGFLGNDWSFSKFYITHRQYFTLIPENLALVYRLGYQTTLTGNAPYFYQSQVITSMLTGATSEGLGGTSTLRGVLRNRVIGDGFAFGNVEFRWKPFHFILFNQECYIGLNAFYDFGIVTNKIELPDNLQSVFDDNMKNYNYDDFFNPGGESFHHSVGISIMPVINRNFVIAIDIGKALNEQDGNIGFSMGLNYMF